MYLKFIAQLAATVFASVAPALLGDNHITVNEGANILILALGAVGVLGAGDLPAGVWAHTKSIVGAATAAAVVLQSALLTDGVSPTEWVQIAIAALGAVGIFAAKGPVVEITGRHAAGRRV